MTKMLKKILNENNFLNEILTILRSGADSKTLNDRLSDYHDNDIAEAFEQLNENERKALYPVLGAERISEIFSYIEDPDEYLRELGIDGAAQVLSLMDSDDAVDAMDDLDLSTRKRLVDLMDDNSSHDVKLIMSYSDDEIGSLMTTNYIVIKNTLNVRQAMQELISQAGENDNISTVYVTNKHDKFFGAIDLKDLIVARADTPLSDIIMLSYPYVSDHAKIDECIERLKDYAEDSIPVIDGSKRLIGVITAEDLMEASDEELSEDYAKLGGLSEQEDLEESTFVSVKKRYAILVREEFSCLEFIMNRDTINWILKKLNTGGRIWSIYQRKSIKTASATRWWETTTSPIWSCRRKAAPLGGGAGCTRRFCKNTGPASTMHCFCRKNSGHILLT